MEKKSNILKNKIVKFAGATLLAGAISVGGLAIYDSTIDHTQEICPFVSILGVQHQVNAINNDKDNWSNGIQAEFRETAYITGQYLVPTNDPVTVTTSAIAMTTTDKDGKSITTYMAPSGNALIGDKCVKTIIPTSINDAIIITKGDVVYPENAQSGDIIHRDAISYENEVVTNILTLKK